MFTSGKPTQIEYEVGMTPSTVLVAQYTAGTMQCQIAFDGTGILLEMAGWGGERVVASGFSSPVATFDADPEKGVMIENFPHFSGIILPAFNSAGRIRGGVKIGDYWILAKAGVQVTSLQGVAQSFWDPAKFGVGYKFTVVVAESDPIETGRRQGWVALLSGKNEEARKGGLTNRGWWVDIWPSTAVLT